MKELLQGKHYKKYFYFICFFIMCICDQRIGSASGEIQLVCPNIVFMGLSCLALSHYSFSDFRKPSFWIPAAICTASACIALSRMWPSANYHYQLLSGALAGILYGWVLIQTARTIFFERRIPGGNRLGVGLMVSLLVLILVSRYDKYNGFLLCLSVVLMYLTDFDPEERDWMLRALGGAILAAFFVFQGLSFVFRPYDLPRYQGLYTNPNINALFYQIVYCVFLSIFCILEIKKELCAIKWGSFCFACAMWSFVFLTMCRSAVLGMTVATFLGYGVVLGKRREARVRRGLLYVCGLLLGCVISFPVVYGTVRYLPAVFHHPVWFGGEYSEWKVHSWDPYDSEKYVDWRDVIQGNFGRFFPNAVSAETSSASESEMRSGLIDAQSWKTAACRETHVGTVSAPETARNWKVSASKVTPVMLQVSDEKTVFSVADMGSETGARQAAVRKGSVDARVIIYRHYLSWLNLWGHTDSENGVQVSDSYNAPHAHNVLLQYAFNYGLPAGIVFVIYLTASGIRLLFLCMRDESDTPFLLGLLLFASIAAFGMTEIIWRYGQLSHTLLLLLPCFAWQHRVSVSDKAM